MLDMEGEGTSLLSLQPSGTHPHGVQSPASQRLSLGPHSTCERLGGQLLLPRGNWGTEGDLQGS